MTLRLPEAHGEAIRRDRPITFHLEGRRIDAFDGDTVASAMTAAGISIIGRSFKYHRPRGLMCMTGSCPNCLVTVDGVPNVRACVEPARDGLSVIRQNAWPSVENDVGALLDRLSFMMPPGFYYKVFQRPRWAWRRAEPFIRAIAGLGRVPSSEPEVPCERIDLHPDVLVIGGGPTGLAAGTEAARAGARTVLLEQRDTLGGHLLESPDGALMAARMAGDARSAGVELMTSAAAFGVFEGPLLAAASACALYRIRAQQIIFATGAVEQLAVFPNNDLPGVMVSAAAGLLLNRYRVLPGRNAVVLTSSDQGYGIASALQQVGADVTVVDLREAPSAASRSAGVRVVENSTVLRATGRRRVSAVEIGRAGDARGHRISCDLLILAGFLAPSVNLAEQAGARLEFDIGAQAFLPVEFPPSVHAAGRMLGAISIEAQLKDGRLAGRRAARRLDHAAQNGDWEPSETARFDGSTPVVLPPIVGSGRGKQLACLCMDVTKKEIEAAVNEGFDSIELLKRYTTVTMGPCQGKACMLSSERLCGKATGRALAETKPTTARPPWTPVDLGTLAGHRRTARKQTTLHHLHVEAGATFMWAGDWRRPRHYTTPDDEVDAVRNRVGLIDVSTLGKFRIKGPEAVEYLERLYPCHFVDLDLGRIRYAVMLTDSGTILDDGTVLRFGDDEFFVTVTTGNTGQIERWMTWWLSAWAMEVQVLNITSAFGAVNVAGPAARTVMERLTTADVSTEGLPYMTGMRMDVGGIAAIVMRLGFVGELGYEIHFPSMYGEEMWVRIMAAGADIGIVPFGIEAQRVLRLEKQHILVGQDTDSESDPFGAGMSWIVKGDKPDFLGKRALRDVARLGPTERLVGFTADSAATPPEGSAVVEDGVWVGRVTSARLSRTAGHVIGLAWVPSGWAVEGRAFDIQFGKQTVRAVVVLRPFYDPEGSRLRA